MKKKKKSIPIKVFFKKKQLISRGREFSKL